MEFLGPRLSSDELSQIWAMGDKSFHVVDNLHGVLAAAAPKLASAQLDHLLLLVQEVKKFYSMLEESCKVSEGLFFKINLKQVELNQ